MTRNQEYHMVLKLRSLVDKLNDLKPHISKPEEIDFNSHIDTMYFVMRKYVKNLKSLGFDLKDLPLGHDLGHVERESRNAMLICMDEKIQKIVHPLDLIASFFVGSYLEDGLIMFENQKLTEKIFGFKPASRYQEKDNFIRHAELGALLVRFMDLSVFKFSKIDTEYLKTAIEYSKAAHTHYTREFEVDGKILFPYKDTWHDGSPIWPVVLPRWGNRMDCIGPCFFVRHFDALLSNREDYTIVNGKRVFHKINIKEHLYPFSLSDEERKTMGTMRTHLEMFLNSQNGDTPYGKNDIADSVMVNFREYQKQKGWEIIQMLDNPLPENQLITKTELFYLIKEVSLSRENSKIRALVNIIMELPYEYKIRWLSAFTKAKEMITISDFPMEKEYLKIVKKLF